MPPTSTLIDMFEASDHGSSHAKSTSPRRQPRLPPPRSRDDDAVRTKQPARPSTAVISAAMQQRDGTLLQTPRLPASSPSRRSPRPSTSSPSASPSASPSPSSFSTSPSALDNLASAIVAGSVATARHAATRTTSPATRTSPPPRPPPPRPPPPRGEFRLTASRTGGSTTTGTTGTPAMPQTLRPERSHSDTEDNRQERDRRGRLHRPPVPLVGGGKHKHKHHEGARRRWREQITERQRRRYEALWASNRGLKGIGGGTLHDQHPDDVPNVVVRSLWRRSRLPADELAEVWDLVDRHGNGRLAKDEFVVGLWLIDQRLRGRKIPPRVSDSVWGSARGMKPTASPGNK